MAVFADVWPMILRHEGGYVDHPADKGGPTNFGITLKTLDAYLKGGSLLPVTAFDVKNLNVTTAMKIYVDRYWSVIRAGEIQSQTVANAFMDMAVLMGPAQAAKLMQSVFGIKQDGIVGPVTLAQINASTERNTLAKFYMACTNFLVRLAAIDPTQVVFLTNWMKRCQEILTTALAL